MNEDPRIWEGNAATRSLNPEFLQAAEELFFQALAMPSLQRDDFLKHRCGDQSHLFSFVNRLLAHYESSVHVAANDHSFVAHDEPDSPPWEPGTLIAGRYRITRVIGSGGMGRVYEAQDEQLPRKVALKGLHRGGSAASPSKRFEREARALSRMGHHHIASIIDSTFEGDQRVLVLEYVEGGTIGDRIRSNRLPVEDVLHFAEQLFHALAAAHEKGILHGDLKPDNLGISEYGSLKVLDFGLSTLLHEELAEAHASEANPAFAGTPAYMSPELFLGHPPSVATDLFSAGIVLYEMLTGSRPADTAGLPHNFSMIAKPTISVRKARPDVPIELDRLITDLLRHDPKERPQSARVALARIKALVPQTGSTLRRHRTAHWRAVSIGAAIAGAAFLFLFSWRFKEPPPDSPADQSYKAGMFAYNNRDYETARTCFRDAIGYDSTYAMAYFQWSHAEAFWDEAEEARRLAATAYHFSPRLPQKEKDLVQSWYFCVTGQPDSALAILNQRLSAKPRDVEMLYQVARIHFQQHAPREAITYYMRSIRVNPRYAPAYNDMSYCFLQAGVPDSALWSAHKYISLQPKEANPYDTMGDIISNIYPDSAWFYYSESLARKSDFAVPLEKLERIALRKGRFEQADSLCARMLDSDDVVYRSKGRLYAAQTSMIRGQFQKALLELDAGIDADINDRATRPCRALKSASRAYAFAYKKEIDAALRELDTAETLPTVQGVGLRDLWRLERIRLLVEAGRVEEVASLTNSLKELPTAPDQWNYLVPAAKGLVALGRGDNARSVKFFEEAIRIDHRTSIHLVHFYAEALARSGRLKEAAAQFRWAIERAEMGTAIDPVILVRSYYRLWQVSETLGDARTAQEARERVIHFWKDADEDVRDMFDVTEGREKTAS